MNYNLKRIALNTLINNETLHSDILSSIDGGVDYWTEIEAPDDQFYDINVYQIGTGHDAFVYIYEQGYNKALAEFFVDLEALMPAESNDEFEVEVLVTTRYKTTVKANDAVAAKAIVQDKLDNYEWTDFEHQEISTKIGEIEVIK
jgi:hypothetical protein